MSRVPTPLQSLLAELERDMVLDEPSRLRERMDWLDRIESLLACTQDDAETCARAHAARARLEAVNCALFAAIREDIRRGARGCDVFARALAAEPPVREISHDGYDVLDVLTSGVLALEDPGAATVPLDTDMVFYQPTPARHVFELIVRAALTREDVLIDLGSGLGHVALLVAICTEARAIGIDVEPAYVAAARACAAGLQLDSVRFMAQDARAADLSAGTLFYLYTPFRGAILREVLDALQREAATRSIRVASFGPCTATLANERWLVPEGSVRDNRLALFRSVPPAA